MPEIDPRYDHGYGYGWYLSDSIPGKDKPFRFFNGGPGLFAVAFPAVDLIIVYFSQSIGEHQSKFHRKLNKLDIFDSPKYPHK